jgi:hypothetical protein
MPIIHHFGRGNVSVEFPRIWPASVLPSYTRVKRHPELPPLRHEELPPPSGSCSRSQVGFAGEGPAGGGADRRLVTGERLDETALSLGAEPVAVAADGQDVAVVQEPVEDRGRDHRIPEHRRMPQLLTG